MIDLFDLYKELHGSNGFIFDALLEFLGSVIGEEGINDDEGDPYNADGQGGEIEKYLAADVHGSVKNGSDV
jgi:hypothetical protein